MGDLKDKDLEPEQLPVEVQMQSMQTPQMCIAKTCNGGQTQSGGVKGVLIDVDIFMTASRLFPSRSSVIVGLFCALALW